MGLCLWWPGGGVYAGTERSETGRLGNILLDECLELSSFSGNFVALELGDGQNLSEFGVKFGQLVRVQGWGSGVMCHP